MRVQRYLILLFLLAGCGEIAVEPVALPSPVPASADYDLSIVSVDFDPALQGNRLPISSTYAVLVAVENRGVLTAYDVRVEATLDQTSSQRRVLQDGATIKELQPGAITVVRIGSLSKLPPEPSIYQLTVQARPLPQEQIVSNNMRTFKITVAP